MSPIAFLKERMPGMVIRVLVTAPSSSGTSSKLSVNAGNMQAAP